MPQTPTTSTLGAANVDAIFKAYDVRGTVPDQLDEDLAFATGSAFVEVVGAPVIVVGHDMRPTRRASPEPSPRARPPPARTS